MDNKLSDPESVPSEQRVTCFGAGSQLCPAASPAELRPPHGELRSPCLSEALIRTNGWALR